jgi:hypothetical protein
VEQVLPFTLITGTEGVTEIEGALIFGPRAGAGDSLIEMLGILGVTEIDGALIFGPRAGAEDSCIEMDGILGVTEIDGGLTWRSLLGVGNPLTEILGMGGVTPIEGTLELKLRELAAPMIDIDGRADTGTVGIEGAENGLGRAGGAS